MLLLSLLACAPSEFLEDPEITNHVEDWRDEVIYQVLVDRFADGDVNNNYNVTDDEADLARYLGGDWRGLMDRADYLEDLGVTAIWISPVVLNVEEDAGVAGYHGYWTQDFESTNPHFGSLAELRELVSVMHERDIVVLLDIVVNHVGQAFYYDINQNGQPDINTYYSTDGSDTLDVVTEWDPAYDPRRIQSFTSLGEAGEAPVEFVYMPEINRTPPQPRGFQDPTWYNRRGRVSDWGDFEQVVYGDFPGGLKDLATENPNVRAELIRIFSDWITRTDIDGFRIDTVKHVEHDFWVEFCTAIRRHAADIGKERFFMFGESFDGDDALIGSYTFDGMLDSVAYFSQKYQIYDDVFKWGAPTSKVADLMALRAVNYGPDPQEGGVEHAPGELLVNFMDNHDVARFLYELPDPAALRSALTYLLTQDGVPVIYYGTEQEFSGGNDPANREPLWWSGYDTSGETFQHVAALNRLRAAYAPLRRGELALTWTTGHTGDEEDAGVLAFEREYDGEVVLVAINTGDSSSTTAYGGQAMAVSFDPGTTLVEVFPEDSGRTFIVQSDGTVSVDLPARYGAVLVPSDQVIEY